MVKIEELLNQNVKVIIKSRTHLKLLLEKLKKYNLYKDIDKFYKHDLDVTTKSILLNGEFIYRIFRSDTIEGATKAKIIDYNRFFDEEELKGPRKKLKL